MASSSNRCSICQKNSGNCVCVGCQSFFCVKHFNEHRQKLSTEFDRDVLITHDELLQRINQIKSTEDSSSIGLFTQIDQWEKITINKIKQTAENVREQLNKIIHSQRETLIEQFQSLTKEIRHRKEQDDFVEQDLNHLQQQINQLKQSIEQINKIIIIENDQIDWNKIINVNITKQTASTHYLNISPNTKWTLNGITVAGGAGEGNNFNQLDYALGLYVDDDQTVLIADEYNHRIVEWKRGATSGQVVAGGNGPGDRSNQLNCPTDVIVNKKTDSLIICDRSNRRVVQWPRRGGTTGQTIISNVFSYGLTIDDDGFLYVSDWEKDEVRRWRIEEIQGTLVAGGNGRGQRLDQLSGPSFVFVDGNHSVYVSDCCNNRVMKWMKDAKEGTVVAGSQQKGDALTQLDLPHGLIVDQLGTIYVSDYNNHRIMRWSKEAKEGNVIVGGNGEGGEANQLNLPFGLSFDRQGNLYVVDRGNNRVQRFSIDVN